LAISCLSDDKVAELRLINNAVQNTERDIDDDFLLASLGLLGPMLSASYVTTRLTNCTYGN